MPLHSPSAIQRYLIGIVAPLAAGLTHVTLDGFGIEATLMPFVLAIAAAAWFGGIGPGLLAVLLSFAVGIHLAGPSPSLDIRGIAAGALLLPSGVALVLGAVALRRQRDTDAAALRACSDAIIVTDAHGRIVSMNPAAQALAGDGSASAAALGTRLAALAAAPAPEPEWVLEHPRAGRFKAATSRVAGRPGSRFGRVVSVLHAIGDRGARPSVAEDANHRRLQSVLDATDARMFHVDRQFRLTWANRALRERHGIADGEGAELATLFDAPKRAALLRPLQRAMEGRREALEWRALDAHGQAVWTFTMITPDSDPQGAVRGCFVLCIDATAWHGTDTTRRRSEDQKRGVLENLPDLVWMATADGTCDWFNHRWAEYSGRSVTDWTDPMPADEREHALRAWAQARADGQPFSIECRLRRHDDVLRWHLVRMQPLHESVTQSTIWGWCGSCTDIDDRKQAEVTLRTTQQRTSAFLGTLSHELRNPLAALTAAIQIMRHPRVAPAMAARAMDTLERQSALLARMVDELLDAARLMDGRIDLQRRCVVLNHLLREVCEDLSPRAKERGVNLHCEVPAQTILVDADVLRIKQAVENLVINALDACPADESVAISTIDGDAGEVGIRVMDTGCGLSPESLASLFEPGSAARSGGRGGGLGLGLKAVKRIMQLHGGRIAAASDGPGKGAVFDLFFPLYDARGARVDVEHDLRRDDLLHGQRILIIGDAGIGSDTLDAQIEQCGAQVRWVKNGFDGLRLMAALQPTALVCGLDLPAPLSGYDVVREATRLAGENRPRLIAIGDDRHVDIAEARTAGFDDCLVRPVSLSRLLGTLADAHTFPATLA